MSDPSDETIELHTDPRDTRVEEQEPGRPRKPWIKGAIAAVVLIIFGAGTWYAYSIGMRTGSEGAAPLIRADQRPTKVKPDDPGGMNVPHQDKTIFDRVKPTDDSKKVEQLLPPPEEPVARPKKPQQQAAAPTSPPAAQPSAMPAPPTAPTPAAAPMPETKAPAADAKTPTPPEPAPPTAAQLAAPPPLATTPTPAPQAAPKPAETPKATTTTPAQTAAAPAKGGTYKVQIASVPSQEQAEKEWAKAKAANSDLLGALTMSIQRADLGAKGIYYRIQAGPLADDTAAKALCSSLQSRKIGCLVVRP